MNKGVTAKNIDKFTRVGIAISAWRKERGMSQDELAEKARISRSTLSNIESPSKECNFSVDTFYNIADVLDVDTATLIKGIFNPEESKKISSETAK